MRQLSFYDHLKAQQVAWARSQNITKEHTEEASGRPWVLKPEFRTLNLWDPDWWALIRNREHRWSRALTSSQCFAVNLFAPLVIDRALAGRALLSLLPQCVLATTDRVEVALEFTPPNGPKWLGERPQQPTQIDAAFVVRRDGSPIVIFSWKSNSASVVSASVEEPGSRAPAQPATPIPTGAAL